MYSAKICYSLVMYWKIFNNFVVTRQYHNNAKCDTATGLHSVCLSACLSVCHMLVLCSNGSTIILQSVLCGNIGTVLPKLSVKTNAIGKVTRAQQQLRWATVATIDIWAEKRGRLLRPFHGELGPRLIQCGLGRGLLPHQVASSSVQPLSHNRHGPKIRCGGGALFLGVAGSPSKTKSPVPRPTSIPSGILESIQPFGHNGHWPKIGSVPL